LSSLIWSSKYTGEEYKSRSSSSCNLSQSPVTKPPPPHLLGPNIFLSTPFPNTLSLHFSHNVSSQEHIFVSYRVGLKMMTHFISLQVGCTVNTITNEGWKLYFAEKSFGGWHLLLLLFFRWHYSLMQTFASLIDFSQSALFFDLSCQFLILHLLISVCTQFHHLFFGRPLSRLPFGLWLNTWLTFFYHPLVNDMADKNHQVENNGIKLCCCIYNK
jgi:hypothetical protein